MNLIVDIGNTIAKVALFDGEAMVNVFMILISHWIAWRIFALSIRLNREL